MTKVHDTGYGWIETPEMSKVGAAWLSSEMADALAATAPPLSAADVVLAASELSIETDAARVVGHLLRHDLDLLSARRIVEALRALRDL